MTTERWKERLEQIHRRVGSAKGLGEAATKQALVLPLLELLGYEIWNPLEVCPEFEGDFAIKKAGQKEKVDLAILFDGTPRIFIEVKPIDRELDGHEGQLARYFNAVPAVSLGVLTNGLEYRFYTDTGQPNLMDTKPFFVFRLDHLDPRLEVLDRFTKRTFDADSIREYATELFYTATITTFLRQELDLRGRAPSEDMVRWILGYKEIYDAGRVTAAVVQRFEPIIATALSTVLREVVRRSVAALDQGVVEPASVPAAPVAVVPAASAMEESLQKEVTPRAGIVTTDNELRAFELVKTALERSGVLELMIFDPSARREVPIELGYNDTTAYFGCYLNKPSWWIARLWVDARQPWVGFPIPPEQLEALVPPGTEIVRGHAHASSGVRIGGTEEIAQLADALAAAVRFVVAQRSGG